MAKAIYIASNGEFIPGIPARDLTSEEWEAIDPKLRASLVKAGVYKEQGSTKKKTKEVSDG